MDVTQLCNSFMSFYYTQFNTNRAGLQGLYNERSMLTFSGERIQGTANIVAKFMSLPPCTAKPNTSDVQPNPATNGAVIVVNGDINIGGRSPAKYVETFLINPTPGAQGQFYIHNHVYRVQE